MPQAKRRDEIQRLKSDPECHLFLSTDSGSVGLNLQVADIVINLDIPWNPAKLEQRIARAWRKHQKRPVQVINPVSENTIGHRMLGLLEQKRSLAAGVLDGKGESTMGLPSGRAALLERIDALMSGGTEKPRTTPADPPDHLRDNRRMANLLTEGGFSTEALVPMSKALETALQALALWQGCSIETPLDLALIDSMLVKTNLPPAEALSLVTALRENQAANDEARTTRLLAQGGRPFLQVASLLTG